MKIIKKEQDKEIEDYFLKSKLPIFIKLDTFPRFVSKRTLLHFICRYEIFKNILNVNGSIVECGVFNGKSLFTWLQLSSIFEPQNFTRKIIGFDTFEGFPAIHEVDKKVYEKQKTPEIGDFHMFGDYKKLVEGIKRIEKNLLNNGEDSKVELVKGDINETVPRYAEEHPHLIVSLLHLDVDLYEPTKTALHYLLPRMPKGAVVVFDELNAPRFPGETLALLEEVGLRNVRLERFVFGTYISFIVLE